MKSCHLRIAVVSMVATVVLITSPMAATAGVKKIWPDKLQPRDINNLSHLVQKDVFHATTGGTGMVYYHAPVKLPVGSEVTRLVMLYKGMSSGDNARVFLRRVKMGEEDKNMATVESDSEDNISEIVKISNSDISLPLVKAGYRYWVNLFVTKAGSIMGIKVYYK